MALDKDLTNMIDESLAEAIYNTIMDDAQFIEGVRNEVVGTNHILPQEPAFINEAYVIPAVDLLITGLRTRAEDFKKNRQKKR